MLKHLFPWVLECNYPVGLRTDLSVQSAWMKIYDFGHVFFSNTDDSMPNCENRQANATFNVQFYKKLVSKPINCSGV
jgi:hypothetical protein